MPAPEVVAEAERAILRTLPVLICLACKNEEFLLADLLKQALSIYQLRHDPRAFSKEMKLCHRLIASEHFRQVP